MLGMSENQASAQACFEVLPPLPGGNESHTHLSGGETGPFVTSGKIGTGILALLIGENSPKLQ